MPLIPIPGMEAVETGRWIGLSRNRKFVCDLMRHSVRVPSVPSQREMRLADVLAASRASRQPISWCAIFLKAYSHVCARRPELRRAFMPYPWPHLYEHPNTVASFSVERDFEGEKAVFFSQIASPEELSLPTLDALIRGCKTAPIESISSFRHALVLSGLPAPLRRMVWWLGLYSDGACRAHFFGTFGISVVASLGASGLHLLSPLTTTLNYGVFGQDGAIDVRLAYDHRVLDGAPIARALAELEDVLHDEIRPELLELAFQEAEPIPA